MTAEFVPYELAVKLKALGFDEPSFMTYLNGKLDKEIFLFNHSIRSHSTQIFVSAPLYQQAFRWFREKYNLRGFIGFRPNVKKFDYHIYDMSLSGMEYVKQRTMTEFNKDPKVGTYEEAELACLEKLIELTFKSE